MSEKDAVGLLGLAARAGSLVFGQEQCLQGVRRGTLHLILLDGSTGPNTRKAFRDACHFHKIPLLELAGHDTLGAGVGRPANKVAGVTDRRLAEQLQKKFEMGTEV